MNVHSDIQYRTYRGPVKADPEPRDPNCATRDQGLARQGIAAVQNRAMVASSRSSCTGLRRYAPAETRLISLIALSTMTGIGPRAGSASWAARNCQPSMIGIIRSSRITQGL